METTVVGNLRNIQLAGFKQMQGVVDAVAGNDFRQRFIRQLFEKTAEGVGRQVDQGGYLRQRYLTGVVRDDVAVNSLQIFPIMVG